MKEEKKRCCRKLTAGLCLLSLTAAMLLSGCGSEETATASGQTNAVTEATAVTAPAETEPLTGYRVETPIGSVYYPEEWTQQLQVVETTEEDTFSAAFSCKLENETVCLFTLSVGSADSGYLLGRLDGQQVWIDVREIDTDRPEAELEQLLKMQERVNDILDQIYHLEGFEKNA